MDPATDLPDDPVFLKQFIVELLQELETQKLLGRQLQNQMEQLLRRFLGRSSEKLDPNQLQLIFAELQELGIRDEESEEEASSDSDDEDEEPPSEPPRRRRGAHGRRRLPKHLPRKRREYERSEEELVCSCGGQQKKIGEKISEQLEYEPARMVVIEHVQFQYGCEDCEETVTIAEKPPQPIDKGLAGPSLLAYVVTSKYADHLPLYRLEGIFDRLGVSLSRQTMCDWMGASANLLNPLVDLMKVDLLKSKKIHTDDTSVPVLDPSLGQTRRARDLAYSRKRPANYTSGLRRSRRGLAADRSPQLRQRSAG